MAKSFDSTCERRSTSRCIKTPLKSTEKIYLVFLMPVILSCIVYMLNFAADIVVALQHWKEDNPIWSISTLVFIYAPAIVYFILTVSRPSWWMTEDQRLTKGVFTWFIIQLCQMIAFPLFAMWRFGVQIVVIVDAILLKGDERVKSLNAATSPAAIELYFFLQAWFQAAPQAVFQIHLLLRERNILRPYQSIIVQVLSIVMSIIIIAIQTASFQRFESQRITGRKLPWATWYKKYFSEELCNIDEKKPLQPGVPMSSTHQESEVNPNGPDEIIPGAQTEAPRLTLERQVSMTPPLPPKNVQMIPPPAPIRGITSVPPLPLPETIAPPRPDSLVHENIDNDTDTSNRTATIDENNQNSGTHWDIKVPQRKDLVKGIEEDNPLGKLIAFTWWFFFITARIIAIVLFYQFHPIWLGGVIGGHYIIMLAYIFYHAKDYNVITFFLNLWLGFVYVFAFIEYRIRFKYADKCLFFYYTFVIIQNVIMTLIWSITDQYDSAWFNYSFYIIFTSTGLFILLAIVYHVLFKPGTRRIFACEDKNRELNSNLSFPE